MQKLIKFRVTARVAGSILGVTALLLPSISAAATQTCRVKPTSVITDNTGGVYIGGTVQPSGTWSWQLVCNVSTSFHNVTTETCRNWTSAALTAQATGKVLFIFFNDEPDGISDCALFPAWNSPYITYLGPES